MSLMPHGTAETASVSRRYHVGIASVRAAVPGGVALRRVMRGTCDRRWWGTLSPVACSASPWDISGQMKAGGPVWAR